MSDIQIMIDERSREKCSINFSQLTRCKRVHPVLFIILSLYNWFAVSLFFLLLFIKSVVLLWPIRGAVKAKEAAQASGRASINDGEATIAIIIDQESILCNTCFMLLLSLVLWWCWPYTHAAIQYPSYSQCMYCSIAVPHHQWSEMRSERDPDSIRHHALKWTGWYVTDLHFNN